MYKTNDVIKNNSISIDEKLWKELNENMAKDDIKQLISDAIATGLPLPYREITSKDSFEDFNALVDFDAESLFGESEFYSRYEYDYAYTNTIINMSNVGNKASDFFHQELRWMCDSINSPSPYRTWNTEKFRLTLLNALWTLKMDKVDSTKLRSAISLRKYIASQFKPSVAKAIYQRFNAEKVLDFSTGWGDRLVAFQATDSVKKYVGSDPNQGLIDTYGRQLESFGRKDDVTIHHMPAEEVNYTERYGEESFDLVFTSPPYFNIERYTQEGNQSWKQYKKIDSWLNDFLFKVLADAYAVTERGGHLVINISDVYSNHTINKICDPMNDFLKSIGAQYVGAYGMRMAKRPNSKAVRQDGVFAEPMWVWRKP